MILNRTNLEKLTLHTFFIELIELAFSFLRSHPGGERNTKGAIIKRVKLTMGISSDTLFK